MVEHVKWRVILARQPQKVLHKLPKHLVQRFDQAINELSGNPRCAGCKKLTGYDNLYRIRVGEWRISYAIEEDQLIVLILEIAPRGGAYRGL